MMKNFVKGLTVCSCLAFGLFNGDCWGMDGQEPVGETSSGAGGSPTLQPLTKKRKVDISQVKSKDFSDSSVSDTDSDGSSSSEEWISDHTELIQKACYEEDSFDSLIDEISEYSTSVENRKMLYKEIESSWNERNIFGATILGDGSFAVYRVERFDF